MSVRVSRYDTGIPTASNAAATGQLLGYARVSTGHQHLEAQHDALTAAGVDQGRVYVDKLSGTSTKEQRPGLTALLDYARPADTIVVTGVDRLGRTAAEVMLTISLGLRTRSSVERQQRTRSDQIVAPFREGAQSATIRVSFVDADGNPFPNQIGKDPYGNEVFAETRGSPEVVYTFIDANGKRWRSGTFIETPERVK